MSVYSKYLVYSQSYFKLRRHVYIMVSMKSQLMYILRTFPRGFSVLLRAVVAGNSKPHHRYTSFP